MNRKTRELIEDERAKCEGRYYDAGLWMGLNWVLEEAEKEAASMNGISLFDVVGIKKQCIIEDLKKAKEELRNRKEKSIGYNSKDGMYIYETNAWPADGAMASILAGELEGLEKAIEILKIDVLKEEAVGQREAGLEGVS